MSRSVKDKVVIITGASQGIGEACALLLAEEGAKVVLASRNKEKLESLARRIHDKGGKAFPVPTDITSPKDVQNLVQKTLDQFQTIDILINNAGIAMSRPVMEISEREMRGVLETNFWGAIFCLRAVLPTMTGKRSGHILNILSQSGRIGVPAQAFYSASKFALAGFSESLRQDLRSQGIFVTMVFPGMVETPMTEAPIEAARSQGVNLHPVSAEYAAKKIFDAIRCKKEEVTFPTITRLLIIAHFFCPKTVERVIAKMRNKMYGIKA